MASIQHHKNSRTAKNAKGPSANPGSTVANQPAAGEVPQIQPSADQARLSPAAARRLNPRSAPALTGIFDLSASLEGERLGPRLAPLAAPAQATPQNPALPPLTELRRFNTTRLLPAKYSESVLTRIAANDEDLQLIFALDNATNERLLAEQNLRLGITSRELVFNIPHYRIINAAFCHPHPQGGRFSMPYRGAWYAGFELATAKAEVLFHRMLQFAEISWQEPEELDYDQYLADFCGSFHDLRSEAFARQAPNPAPLPPGRPQAVQGPQTAPGKAKHAAKPTIVLKASADPAAFAACLNPQSYIASQQLTLELLEAGAPGILYPSTRKAAGNCIACFRPSLVSNVRKRDLYRLTWYPDRGATFLRCARSPGTTPSS